MIPPYILNATTISQILVKIDNDLAEEARLSGCPYCGSALHQADYPRTPHGLSDADSTDYQFRRSFCCSDCRRRTTPATVRFFGRRWYVAPTFILLNALSSNWSHRRRAQIIQRHFGLTMSKRTLLRWRRW